MAGRWYLLSYQFLVSFCTFPDFGGVGPLLMQFFFQAEEWDCGKELLQSKEAVSEADASD